MLLFHSNFTFVLWIIKLRNKSIFCVKTGKFARFNSYKIWIKQHMNQNLHTLILKLYKNKQEYLRVVF